MWNDGFGGGYGAGNYDLQTDDDFLNALALPQFQAGYQPGPSVGQAQMATPGGYSNPGTSTGAGTGSGYPSTGYSGPQSLGSSNSSFVMISPVASGSGGAAPLTGDYNNSGPGIGTGLGMGSSYRASGVSGSQNLGLSNSSFVNLSPISSASGSQDAAAATSSNGSYALPQLTLDAVNLASTSAGSSGTSSSPASLSFNPGAELLTRMLIDEQIYQARRNQKTFQPGEYDALRKASVSNEPFFDRDTRGPENYFQFPELEMPYDGFDIQNWRQDQYMASLPGGQPGADQPSPGLISQGQPQTSQFNPSQMAQGQPGQGQMGQGQSAQGQMGQGQMGQGQMGQGQPAQGQMGQGQTGQGQVSQGQTSQVPTNQNQGGQSRNSFTKFFARFR